MQNRFGRFVIVLTTIFALFLMASSRSIAQAPLTPVPGSPFNFSGSNSNVTLLSSDESHLFVTNQNSGQVSVLNVAGDGSLTMQGNYQAISYSYGFLILAGMSTNPAGNRLYVVGTGFNGMSAVSVMDIAPDGSLTLIQEMPLPYGSTALNSITYVSQAGGDTLYVNGNSFVNAVSAFPVAPDGTLGFSTEYATGGTGGGYFYATPTTRTVSQAGKYLYVTNGHPFTSGSYNISAFAINPDGSLTLVPGSPFSIPNATCSGAIAVDPAGSSLYAGASNGRIAKFAIAPDGSLSTTGAVPTGIFDMINGFDISPDGATLLATTINTTYLYAVDTASLRILLGAPVYTNGNLPGGIHFNGAGTRAFVGFANSAVKVGVYDFTQTPATPPLTISLTADPNGSLDKFGRATLSGKITTSIPGNYTVYLTLRQKKGRDVVEVSGNVTVTTTGLNGSANWTWVASSNSGAFGGGKAELVAVAGGYDPVTFEPITVSITQVVNLKGK